MKRSDMPSAERALRERHADLQARIAGLTKAPERGSGISFGKRVGDGTTEAVSRLNEVGVVDSLNVSVARVKRALAKLAEGTYGTCDVCGREIPALRLEAQPESVACVNCAGLARRVS
ncbi:MAG: TraR/DksA C4-type zinc finger protein [Thermoleophilaceae bacterium]